MNIGSIVWPTDAKAACDHYLTFIIQVIERLGIVFPTSRPNPLVTAKGYLAGTVPESVYKAEIAVWWDYLDSTGAIREFRNKDALTARLAICLLAVTREEAPQLGDHLSWFFEVLFCMGFRLDEPIAMMNKYFAPKAGGQ